MRRLLFIFLLTCHSAGYTIPKGFYWIESGGLLGNQVDAFTKKEINCTTDYIEKEQATIEKNIEKTKTNIKAYVSNIFEQYNNSDDIFKLNMDIKTLNSKSLHRRSHSERLRNDLNYYEAAQEELDRNTPLQSRVISLQSGIGYQFSKYLALEVNHFVFWSTAQLDENYFLFDTKTTRIHNLIIIGKPSLPLYPKFNVYAPLGLGLAWTHIQNGEDQLSIPMRIPFICGLGGQYALSDQWTLHGEWMHIRIPEIGPFNLFKVGFQFYKT